MVIPALLLSGWLTLAWVPRCNVISYDPPASITWIIADNSYYTELGARAEWWALYVQGYVRIPVWATTHSTFWPNQLQSYFDAGITMGPVQAGWRHQCTHPIYPFMGLLAWDGDQIIPGWDSGSDVLYLRVNIGGTSDGK